MPARNVESLIARSVASVVGQSLADLELIVVDDGSTDETVAAALSSGDPRVRIIEGPARGIAAGRNTGLAAARGAYVAWLDADDLAAPDRARLQSDFLDANPGVLAVGTSVDVRTEDGGPAGVLPAETRPDRIAALLAAGRNALMQPTVMVRTEAARRAGGYEERLGAAGGEDREFHCRLARLGPCANLAEPLTEYLLRSGAVSNGLEALPRRLMRARERALTRVCGGDIADVDVALLLDIADAAARIDPERAYRFRVGKVLLATGADPEGAVGHLLAAWRMQPWSVRTLKRLLQARRAATAGPGATR